mmetsp:Transcript_6919/g.10094  ORF Transcript_6919/g.10094 Transcript_6919/m.10094 type:complete len:210 (+) Transcript_6919:102-731(+)
MMKAFLSLIFITNASWAWVQPGLISYHHHQENHQSVTFASSQEQMEFMTLDDDGNRNSVFDKPDLTTDLALAKIVAKAADGRKAEDIVCLEVAHITTMTCYLIILTGNSRPQNQAIAAAIMEDVEEEVGLIKNPEGTADSGWMLLDYGSVMVHIMTPKSRLYYNIEGQWRDKGGTGVDIEDVLVPNKLEEQRSGNTMEGLTEEEDPFWS